MQAFIVGLIILLLSGLLGPGMFLALAVLAGLFLMGLGLHAITIKSSVKAEVDRAKRQVEDIRRKEAQKARENATPKKFQS